MKKIEMLIVFACILGIAGALLTRAHAATPRAVAPNEEAFCVHQAKLALMFATARDKGVKMTPLLIGIFDSDASYAVKRIEAVNLSDQYDHRDVTPAMAAASAYKHCMRAVANP